MAYRVYGDFEDTSDEAIKNWIQDQFDVVLPHDIEIIVASYDGDEYNASAGFVFRSDGKLWEVQAGHCSCYGFEGQWQPTEVTPAYLASDKASSPGFWNLYGEASKEAKRKHQDDMMAYFYGPREEC